MIQKNEDIDRELTWQIWHEILEWGSKNRRAYPWRDSPSGYKILIAEVMLHRTNADQVNNIYCSFITNYPDFKSILSAGPDKIRSELQSLGLTWRSSLLYEMSNEICRKYNGVIPLSKQKLMELPGVGQYIASAVLCFGYNMSEPILDTNTVRVIGRIFGIKVTDSARRSKKFEEIMRDIISYGEPRRFSLSLIDFAALVCKNSRPKCDICPLKNICFFHKFSIKL